MSSFAYMVMAMFSIVIYLVLTFFLFFIELFIWLDKFDEFPDLVELTMLWLSAAVQVFVVLVFAKFAGWL